MSSRDRWTDASRDGSGQLQKKDLSIPVDFYQPISVGEENDRGGWDPKAAPTGGTPAPPKLRGGMGGAADDRAERNG